MKFSLEGLAFAHIEAQEENPQLIKWNFIEPEKFPLTDKNSFNHPIFVQIIEELVKQIPSADIIVYEQLMKILPRDPRITVKIKLGQMETSLLSMLSLLQPKCSIHNMRYDVINNMYGLKVGSERTNVSKKIKDILPGSFDEMESDSQYVCN